MSKIRSFKEVKRRARVAFHHYAWVLKSKIPISEGEATARVIDSRFKGYPLPERFKSKEDAVALLETIWMDIDNWDGSKDNNKLVKEQTRLAQNR